MLTQGSLFGKSLTFTKQWWDAAMERSIPEGGTRINRSLFLAEIGEGIVDFLKESKVPMTATELISRIDSNGRYIKNNAELLLYLREKMNHRIKIIEPSQPSEPYRYGVLTPHMLRKREIQRYELEVADLKGVISLGIADDTDKKDAQRALRRYRYRLRKWENTTNAEAQKQYERFARLGE